MDTPSTRATLLERLRDGQDVDAWREFYDLYQELVLAVARRWGLQSSDCDDVLQETLARLARALPEFRYDPGRGRFRSYLKTTVTSVIVTRLRQTRRGTGVQALENHHEPADPGDVDEIWETEWRRHHVRMAMRRVRNEFSERDIDVFDRYAVRDGDATEIAQASGLSVDQVYQIKSRIARRISTLIDEQIAREG